MSEWSEYCAKGSAPCMITEIGCTVDTDTSDNDRAIYIYIVFDNLYIK